MKTFESNKWDNTRDEITRDFENTFGSLSIHEMNWKPNSNTWSIAQNMDHLINTNRSYFPIIESAKNGTYKMPFSAKFGILVNFFGKTILKGVHTNRKKKVRIFKIWEPEENKVFKYILDEFKSHQNELKKLISDSSDLIANGFVIPSPANKHIVYKLETAFDIIISHERRHFEQAKEILNDENFLKVNKNINTKH